MAVMKKLIALVLVMVGIGISNAQYRPSNIIKSWSWDGYDHVVFESDGHWYLEVRSQKFGGVHVIHYESCPCKNRSH